VDTISEIHDTIGEKWFKRLKKFPSITFRRTYDHFDAPVTSIDCGKMCAPHNPNGKPFCCDICSAVPAAYRQEWDYLKNNTDLWRTWRADDCTPVAASDPNPISETPAHMLLLTCQGPNHCQRNFRALSCRQFPFFPYITADDRFIGLAYEWIFEPVCWVISNLDQVTQAYRQEFIRTYDEIFALWPHDYESYAIASEQMRDHFAEQKRRIPILHRSGAYYLLSPKSERMQRVSPNHLKQFGPYRLNF
jgi:hypothetical protein